MTNFSHRKSLINELRQDRYDDIKKAINNVLRVRMYYDDKKGGKGKNERYILPVAFGRMKSGKLAVRAYETMGSSKRGLTNPPNRRKIPKWKLFLVDNIFGWSNGKKSFREYKDTLIKLGLNTHGDKQMTALYAITPFADSDVQVAKSMDKITSEPIRKSDVQPTTDLQNKDTTDKEKFISAGDARKSETPIEKTPKNDYLIKKMTAPEPEPITKAEIQTSEPQKSTSDETLTDLEAGGEPITKDDVNNGGESKEDIKKSFDDMMNRMDNLYKDNEEKEEEEEL